MALCGQHGVDRHRFDRLHHIRWSLRVAMAFLREKRGRGGAVVVLAHEFLGQLFQLHLPAARGQAATHPGKFFPALHLRAEPLAVLSSEGEEVGRWCWNTRNVRW